MSKTSFQKYGRKQTLMEFQPRTAHVFRTPLSYRGVQIYPPSEMIDNVSNRS